MLSKKNKKRVAKAKRTTKKYLTKWGIRQPRNNPDLDIQDYINSETTIEIDKFDYSLKIGGFLQYFPNENLYFIRDNSSYISFSKNAIDSIKYKESADKLIITLK